MNQSNEILVKVHAVPTEKANTTLFKNTETGQFFDARKLSINSKSQPYHLYLTSDEKIKEGDWKIELDGTICKAGWENEDTDRKIVATTNPELWSKFLGFESITGERMDEITNVAKIPKDFIEVFVKEQGILDVTLDKNEHITVDAIDSKTGLIGDNTYKLNSQGEVIWRLKEKVKPVFGTWISVFHKPFHGQYVLTYRPDSEISDETISIIPYGSVAGGFPEGVTHWMPLPEPPIK